MNESENENAIFANGLSRKEDSCGRTLWQTYWISAFTNSLNSRVITIYIGACTGLTHVRINLSVLSLLSLIATAIQDSGL